MTGGPKISVIVPCFNLGQYLDEAVDSVLAQTVQDFEILIVDDGSTDPETIRILEGYKKPKTSVFRTDNHGLASARNFLIARARGEYLCALDADDKLHPEFFEKTLTVLDRDLSCTFVSTHLQMFGAEDRIWPDEARCDLPALLCDDTIITPAVVRRDAVLAVGGYDEQMPHQGDEDWDLWLSLVKAGHKGIILPEILFFYRRRPGSMCDQCTIGQTHLDLIDYLVRKHGESYRAHLLHVLLWKEGCIDDLRRSNGQLEDELTVSLEPNVKRRQAELEALRSRLAEARALAAMQQRSARVSELEARTERQDQDLDALRSNYRRTVDDLGELRKAYEQNLVDQAKVIADLARVQSSTSWKITAPLRRLRGLVLKARGRHPL